MEINFALDGLEYLEKELEYLKTHAVKVGVLGKEGAGEMKYPITFIQEYAVHNEYGTTISKGKNKGMRHIPPRPFFRLSVATARAQKEIQDFMADEIEKVISTEITGEQYYKNVGNFVVERIKKTIYSYGFKPNNPYTIKKKNQSNPLVDTGSLYNSISYEIVEV